MPEPRMEAARSATLPGYRDGKPWDAVVLGHKETRPQRTRTARDGQVRGNLGVEGVEVEQGRGVGVTYGEGIPEGEVLLRR